ncbi:hypothetical protein MGG_17287 [Pyricularia oryzae 70-15]|uniref:monoamine oxidase n=1 Tax=Pyricularia oryzae (strain 70-15 / ATCC MYA-4617 / FGSC 8958) TaxID=242507 RepID=G4NAW9_PYRO7|nr:uncharacterized protein MGG_17287 [Pyricularia oryzae 70-15]EHA51353.1 hypothetical protein MGG_17287 [Pyricularia oryzae 70-15]
MGKVKTLDLSNTIGAYFAPATIIPAGSRLLHLAGQVGATKNGTVPADYESQVHLALLNLRKIIVAAGAGIKDIAKLTLYIVNYDHSKRLHARHVQKFLRGHRPAITLVPVQALAVASWLFEVDAVVVQPDPASNAPPPALSAARASDKCDVVIVGAGLAGLSAAHELIRAGLSCIVLESRDRVGGKTWSQELAGGGGVVDLGAAWINDTNQSRMYNIAQRYGAELIEQNTQGRVVLEDLDGKVSSFTYGDLPHPAGRGRYSSLPALAIKTLQQELENVETVGSWLEEVFAAKLESLQAPEDAALRRIVLELDDVISGWFLSRTLPEKEPSRHATSGGPNANFNPGHALVPDTYDARQCT